MGNEQSRNNDNSRQPNAVSREEVNRMLEQQRKEYERKLQQLNIRQAARPVNPPVQQAARPVYLPVQQAANPVNPPVQQAANPVNPPVQQAANPVNSPIHQANLVNTPQQAAKPANSVEQTREARAGQTNMTNIDGIIAQQLQDFIQIISENNTRSSSTGTQKPKNAPPIPPRPSFLQTESTPSTSSGIERSRNPYSYTKEELRTGVGLGSPQSLYPNLGSATANLTKPNIVQAQQTNRNNNSHEGFVFVNTPPRHLPQPSAPPLEAASGTSPNVRKPTPKQFTPRPSSSRSNSNKNEEDELNCITCGNKYGLNIFQCPSGHSSCRDCKLRQALCGICRKPVGDTRNITLEAYISEVKLAACVREAELKTPCPNHADGCNLLLKTADIEAHLKECPFKEYICPLVTIFGARERCTWKGKLSDIVAHFDCVHPAHRQANVDMELVLLNIFDDNHVVHLVELSPYIFLVHFKVSDEDRKIYMTVQLLGTQISASKWNYELHVYNKREPRRKFLHSDVCSSSVVPLKEVFREKQCVVIPQSYALSFVNEGCMNYKFYIKRDVDVPSFSRGRGRGKGRGRGRGAKVYS